MVTDNESDVFYLQFGLTALPYQVIAPKLGICHGGGTESMILWVFSTCVRHPVPSFPFNLATACCAASAVPCAPGTFGARHTLFRRPVCPLFYFL